MPKTVQLNDDTYRALKTLKVGDMTFDDVVRGLLVAQDAEKFQRAYRVWQKSVFAEMKRSPSFERL